MSLKQYEDEFEVYLMIRVGRKRQLVLEILDWWGHLTSASSSWLISEPFDLTVSSLFCRLPIGFVLLNESRHFFAE